MNLTTFKTIAAITATRLNQETALNGTIPYHKGKRAKALGLKITINPFPHNSKAFKAWEQGYKGEHLL